MKLNIRFALIVLKISFSKLPSGFEESELDELEEMARFSYRRVVFELVEFRIPAVYS